MEIAVLIGEGVTASDAVNPAEVFSAIPGSTVKFVGTSKGFRRTIPGRFAMSVDHTLDEVPRPDVIVVPADLVSASDPQTLDWLRSAHETSTWTVSVCGGSVTLAAAGILDGVRATGHWMSPDMLAAHGATFVNERWVRSGKIVTAAGNSAGIDMSLWLLGEIAGEDLARATQLLMEYDPQPPFDSGTVAKAGPATTALAVQAFQEMLSAAGVPADFFDQFAQATRS